MSQANTINPMIRFLLNVVSLDDYGEASFSSPKNSDIILNQSHFKP